jgi:hypothetical protein
VMRDEEGVSDNVVDVLVGCLGRAEGLGAESGWRR